MQVIHYIQAASRREHSLLAVVLNGQLTNGENFIPDIHAATLLGVDITTPKQVVIETSSLSTVGIDLVYIGAIVDIVFEITGEEFMQIVDRSGGVLESIKKNVQGFAVT